MLYRLPQGPVPSIKTKEKYMAGLIELILILLLP